MEENPEFRKDMTLCLLEKVRESAKAKNEALESPGISSVELIHRQLDFLNPSWRPYDSSFG